MAGDADDIVVHIEDEIQDDAGNQTVVLTEDTGGKQTAPRAAQPDDPIEALKAQLADKSSEIEREKSARAAAESAAAQERQRADAARREAADAHTQVAASTKTTIESGIAAAKAEADAAEEAYKTAFEAGNAGEAAKAQRRMSRAEADLAMLEQAKAELPSESAPKKLPSSSELRPSTPSISDQTEQWIRAQDPRAQTWLRAHMDYATDASKNAKLVSAHWDAAANNIQPNTEGYFQHIEKVLGLSKEPQPKAEPKPAANGGSQHQAQPSQRRPTAPVAPVTPSAGGVQGGAQTVTLTAGEARAATDGTHVHNWDDPKGKYKKGDPIGVQEFARRKAIMMKEGRYQNINIDGT
jgi:hypothetical protein